MDIDAKEAEIFESQSNASARSFIDQAIYENEAYFASSYRILYFINNPRLTSSNTE